MRHLISATCIATMALATALPCNAIDLDEDNVGPYTLWAYENEDRDENLALVVRGSQAWGIDGERRDAEVINGRSAKRAVEKVRDAYDSETLSVVEIDKNATNGGINLVAEGDDGEDVKIIVADGQLVFHADDGEDSISFSIGSSDVDVDSDASVNIRAREHDGDEGGVVVIRGATEKDVHEFVDDLDDVPSSVKRELLKEIGL